MHVYFILILNQKHIQKIWTRQQALTAYRVLTINIQNVYTSSHTDVDILVVNFHKVDKKIFSEYIYSLEHLEK